MTIGFIGAGRVTQAIASRLVGAGHSVSISNSKGCASVAQVTDRLGPLAHAITPDEALQFPIVVLAVPWKDREAALKGLPAWHGRVLIDATNQYVDGKVEDLHGQVSSELIAALAPGAWVVKAFNSLHMERVDDGPKVGDGTRVMFVSGDDPSAKELVSQLIRDIGFCPIDLGSLAVGGFVQQAGGPLAGVDLVQFDHKA